MCCGAIKASDEHDHQNGAACKLMRGHHRLRFANSPESAPSFTVVSALAAKARAREDTATPAVCNEWTLTRFRGLGLRDRTDHHCVSSPGQELISPASKLPRAPDIGLRARSSAIQGPT